jgi:hypothetical protein
MIITIVSPDKLTLSMFSNYINSIYSTNSIVIVRDINFLYSERVLDALLDSFIKEAKDNQIILIKFKSKTNLKKIVPQTYLDKSDYVLKFDMYSTKAEVLKATDSKWITEVINRWDSNIDKFNTM